MSVDVVLRFVDAINAGDVAGIAALMTEDHRFVDSLGEIVVGREKMCEGWRAYLGMVPDYGIVVDETVAEDDVVVLVGSARGTYAPDGQLRSHNAWETPAAWRATVRGGRVAEWRVYADNEPIRRLMADEPP